MLLNVFFNKNFFDYNKKMIYMIDFLCQIKILLLKMLKLFKFQVFLVVFFKITGFSIFYFKISQFPGFLKTLRL